MSSVVTRAEINLLGLPVFILQGMFLISIVTRNNPHSCQREAASCAEVCSCCHRQRPAPNAAEPLTCYTAHFSTNSVLQSYVSLGSLLAGLLQRCWCRHERGSGWGRDCYIPLRLFPLCLTRLLTLIGAVTAPILLVWLELVSSVLTDYSSAQSNLPSLF